MECNICMESCTNAWKCACTAVTCKDCFQVYISFQSKVAVCIGAVCNRLVNPMKLVGWLDSESVALYKVAVVKYLNAFYSGSVKAVVLGDDKKKLIDLTRERFLQKYPLCIRITISNVLLDKVAAHLKYVFEDSAGGYFERCLLTSCIGHMFRGTCDKCGLARCTSCGEGISATEKHSCNPDNVASLELLSKSIKCPRCKVPIEKSSGCNSLTCAVCGTKFDMVSGQIGQHGGHSVMIPKEKLKTGSLSSELSPFYEDALIKQIKNLEVSSNAKKIDSITSSLVTSLATPNSQDKSINLYFKLQEFENGRRTLHSIEKLHLNGNLSTESLEKLASGSGSERVRVSE